MLAVVAEIAAVCCLDACSGSCFGFFRHLLVLTHGHSIMTLLNNLILHLFRVLCPHDTKIVLIHPRTGVLELFMLTTRSDDPKHKGSLSSPALKKNLFCGNHTEERSGVKSEHDTWLCVSGHSLSSGTAFVFNVLGRSRSLSTIFLIRNENANGTCGRSVSWLFLMKLCLLWIKSRQWAPLIIFLLNVSLCKCFRQTKNS